MAGLTVTNQYDRWGRRTNLAVLTAQNTVLYSVAYAYDNADRLQTLSSGPYSASYSYLANSPLVHQITFRSNALTVMTTINQYDQLNRLTKTESWAGTNLVARAAYGYNLANQRVAQTNADGSYWLYQYDALGQLIRGQRFWPDGTPVLGQQFEYGFDDIGNRTVAVRGGDRWGGNKRYQNYTANLLNQYTSRTVPGYFEVLGSAHSNATVSVWTDPTVAVPALPGDPPGYFRTSRQGEYFRAELGFDNLSAPVWAAVTNWRCCELPPPTLRPTWWARSLCPRRRSCSRMMPTATCSATGGGTTPGTRRTGW